MAKYEVNYKEFSELVKKISDLEVSFNDAAHDALEEVAPTAVKVYQGIMPYDDYRKDDIHAYDNVRASRTEIGKNGPYKLIGVFTENGLGFRDWSIGQYLFYVEYGTSRMPAYPFMENVKLAIKQRVTPQMKASIKAKIEALLGG